MSFLYRLFRFECSKLLKVQFMWERIPGLVGVSLVWVMTVSVLILLRKRITVKVGQN